MKSLIRTMALLPALVVASAVTSHSVMAQGRPLEIRADFASLESNDGRTVIALKFPGSLAMAFYMNQQFAIEPSISVTSLSGDNDGTLYGAGLFFPFYFKADEGRSGFFVSPGAMVSGGSGDYDRDASFDYGVDLGIKMPLRERISSRLALTIRDGDSYNDLTFGATFGIGFFWR